MAKDPDLEQLKQALGDSRVWVACGQVVQLDLVEDRSVWRAKVKILPDGHDVVARITWEGVGPKAGIYHPLQVGDMVAVGMPEGSEDNAFVLKRFSSKADTIPLPAKDLHTVIKCLEGKKLLLGKAGDQESDEPMLLGLVVKQLLIDVLDELKTVMDALAVHTHIGNLGSPTAPPDNLATYTSASSTFSSKKSSPVEDDKINSDVIFGEKGD